MRNILNAKRFKIALKKSLSAPRIVLLGFLSIILIGALLLMTPIANSNGQSLNFTDALFTATSALCVTGLTINITATSFTTFGHIIILVLIQTGGLGLMTISSALYLLIGKRFTLYNRMTLKSDFQQVNFQDFGKLIVALLKVVFVAEFIGAVLLSIAFSRYFPIGTSIWYGIFHSISAFCNAGFDIVSTTGVSMQLFATDPFILLTLASLIIVGGLGFIVVIDILKQHKWRKFQLQSKIVLPMTLILIVSGMVIFLLAEWNNPATMGNMSVGEKFLNAFFQSTTTRTAGFSAISNADLASPSLPTSIILMFIGASPGSTGGGLKTVTFFILIAAVIPTMKDRKAVIFDMHRFGAMTIKKATTMLMLAFCVILMSYIGLTASDGIVFTNEQLLFELVSAYATVGLSMNVTIGLSVVGKFIIIFNMFVGRIGTLTFFMALTQGNINARQPKIKYPEANINM
ncbi:MAG: potassium transporter TrkG [Clostridia bacterium]|nr:potassium transporter TrkG [Clostridia bacterium]